MWSRLELEHIIIAAYYIWVGGFGPAARSGSVVRIPSPKAGNPKPVDFPGTRVEKPYSESHTCSFKVFGSIHIIFNPHIDGHSPYSVPECVDHMHTQNSKSLHCVSAVSLPIFVSEAVRWCPYGAKPSLVGDVICGVGSVGACILVLGFRSYDLAEHRKRYRIAHRIISRHASFTLDRRQGRKHHEAGQLLRSRKFVICSRYY